MLGIKGQYESEQTVRDLYRPDIVKQQRGGGGGDHRMEEGREDGKVLLKRTYR